jgi:hypothetical protein
MKQPRGSKQGTSFRLTPEARQLLVLMARKLGLPRGVVLERLIRERAQQEGVSLGHARDGPSAEAPSAS